MANLQRNFITGRMNKSLELRLLPNGEYVDALNVRLGSTEQSEVGSVENSKGNTEITQLAYINGTLLSDSARCLGAFEDGANETIYWFVHDPAFTQGATGKLDLIVAFNVITGAITYHVISIDNGEGINTTLKFNPNYLITGVDKIEDLLFFTDNINPPRVINIKTNYPNPSSNIDQFDAREIMVVQQPPLQAPTFQLIQSSDEDTFMTSHFICFAYRYKYANDEYSATSQFSEPAFQPDAFNFSAHSFQNEGMENRFNAAVVTYNSGSEQVKGIDILFKEANDATIKVIERINKAERDMVNNTFYDFTFSDSKIFSVLPESEILRLFDNVPTLAKAQTLMGNRLVYGNYMEGYDLKDTYNKPLDLSYVTSVSSAQVGSETLPVTTASQGYTFNPGAALVSIENSVVRLNLTGQMDKLIIGATIYLSFTFEHDSWYLDGHSAPDQTTGSTTVHFSYTLIQDFYTSGNPLNDLIVSDDFIARLGTTTAGIQTVADAQEGEGTTLTDHINFALEADLGSTPPVYDINRTGRTSSTPALPSAGEGILVSVYQTNSLQLQILAAEYKLNGGSDLIVEYFKITSASATLQSVPNTSSLHSNRGYEVGIVYMDSFNRASTALVSLHNTVSLDCSKSITQNIISVTIPVTQRAPSFATRYKFCIKADNAGYDTIYSSIYFEDDSTNNVFFLLEGDNIGKVEDGDRLIVKRDVAGPLQRCVEATVLEVKNQLKDFIDVTPLGEGADIPAGVYMKMNSVSFQAKMEDDDLVDVKVEPVVAEAARRFPILAYPFFMTTAAGVSTPYTFPIGTRVVMEIEQTRPGIWGGIAGCEERSNLIEHTFICSEEYATPLAFFNGENVGVVLEQNAISTPSTTENEYIAETSGAGLPSEANRGDNKASDVEAVFGGTADDPGNNLYYRLYEDTTPTPNLFYLLVSGGPGCASRDSGGDSTVRVDFSIYRRDSVVVFETQPKPALPDLWYEGAQSFEIDTLGNHLGNVTNQDIEGGTPAVITTDFSNCYAFGNGVESYKILDASFGRQFNLGNRTFSTSNTTYKQAHRFADLTYSGVYNDESNVNKLNEFNLGLLNFKPLEETFGDVEILHARRDDILVLQEDKVSYVLAGKDLLSDASGDGQLTSVPTVLGKQIARIENYGISNHPESFAVWGENKFFTDAKRSAVLNLIGSSSKDEQLLVISEAGMRSWFRDLFTYAFGTQKLGAYDPYMNEYVLSSNTILKPEVPVCLACGVTKDITVPTGTEFTYCVDLEEQIGTVLVTYNIPAEGAHQIVTEDTSSNQDVITEVGDDVVTEGGVGIVGYTITVLYNGSAYTSGLVFGSSSFTFEKDSTVENQAVVEVTTDSSEDDTIEITVGCPSGTILNLYSICVTDAVDAGKFIHNEASWTDGSLFSATQSNLIVFGAGTDTFVISQYNIVSGNQGVGLLPTDGSVMTVATNKINFDDFVFDTTANGFSYLRTDTEYASDITDITTLLGLTTTIPLNITGAPSYYNGVFTVPASGSNLYLIYDYRDSTVPVPSPVPATYDYKQYQECDDASIVTIVRGAISYSFPDFFKLNDVCYENHAPTSSVSNTDIAPLPTYVDCATCSATVPVPTPVPTPTHIYREYFNCDDRNVSQIFRQEDGQGVIWPGAVKYPLNGVDDICLQDPDTTGSTSLIDLPLLQYTNCSNCQETLNPPVPPPVPPVPTPPVPPPTPSDLFKVYTKCNDSTTQVFFQTSATFPTVIDYQGDCYDNAQPTALTTGVSTSGLSTYDDCAACQGVPPTPPQPPTPPVPTPLFYRLIGCLETTAQCYYQAEDAPDDNQRYVESLNTQSIYRYYSGDVGQNSDQGNPCLNTQAVESEVDCPPVPPPPSPPVPPVPTYVNQDIEIQECYTTSPRYLVRVTNQTAPSLQVGTALRIDGPSGPGGTPAMDGTKFWEVTNAAAPDYNTLVTYIEIQGDCTGFAPPPVPTPPVPPPTPTTVYAQYVDCETGGDIVAHVSGPSGTTFPTSLLISGVCYEYDILAGSTGQSYTNFDDFADCATCNAAVPTPTPTPPTPPTPSGSCLPINYIATDAVAASACSSSRRETMYFDDGQLCQATAFYRTANDCSSLDTNPVYISDGNYYRYWNGSSFGTCLGCD